MLYQCQHLAQVGQVSSTCVLVVCMWQLPILLNFDASQDTNTLDKFKEDLVAQLRPVAWANVVFTSAKTGQRLPKVLDAVAASGEQHRCTGY